MCSRFLQNGVASAKRTCFSRRGSMQPLTQMGIGLCELVLAEAWSTQGTVVASPGPARLFSSSWSLWLPYSMAAKCQTRRSKRRPSAGQAQLARHFSYVISSKATTAQPGCGAGGRGEWPPLTAALQAPFKPLKHKSNPTSSLPGDLGAVIPFDQVQMFFRHSGISAGLT